MQSINYRVIYAVHQSKIYADSVALIAIVIATGFFLILLTLTLGIILAKSITKPLSFLTYHISQVGTGNLNTSINVTSADEIGVLTQHFNEMVQNVRQLTSKLVAEESAKKDYELQLLQSQINPHFLYNCLDNTHALIENKQYKTATDVLTRIGRYYRYVLSKGRHIITLDEEIKLTCEYLEIQLLKFPQLFTYSIDIQDNLKHCKIQKMLLQPIVENSILHGFINYKNNRFIQIVVKEKGNDLHIQIIDNGRGTSHAFLKNGSSNFNVSIPNHFGLKNINDRIEIKYGKPYGLKLESQINLGTTVEIVFPKLL